jgi:hypothetical protein
MSQTQQKSAAAKGQPRNNAIQQPIIPFSTFKNLSQPERLSLLKGPKLAFRSNRVVGNRSRELPKRLLMAVSPVVNLHCISNPTSSTLHLTGLTDLYDVDYDKGALPYILSYLLNVCKTKKFYSLPPLVDDFSTTLSIYSVCQVLQLEEFGNHVMMHLAHLAREVDYPELDWILAAAGNDTSDPLFMRVAQTLAHQRRKGFVDDVQEFKDWLEEHPELEEAMDEIDAEYKARGKEGPERDDGRDRALEVQARRAERVRLGIEFVRVLDDDFDGRYAEDQGPDLPMPDVGESGSEGRPRTFHIGAEAERKLGKKF